MSLCEPIRREIESEEEYLMNEYPIVTPFQLEIVKNYAMGMASVRPAWCNSDYNPLIELWRQLAHCELEAAEEMRKEAK